MGLSVQLPGDNCEYDLFEKKKYFLFSSLKKKWQQKI